MKKDEKAQRNYLHLLWRPISLVVWIISMCLLFSVARLLKFEWHRQVPHIFHRGCQFIFGLNVEKSGAEETTGPVLFVSNHISYLDIFVLGTVKAYFIAKSEVANWPVLGWLAQFQNTLFIERNSTRARKQMDVMKAHLGSGQSLILFPEGTSTAGDHVVPFKSSLFEAASDNGSDENLRVKIQPVTIAYTHQAGRRMSKEVRDNYAWYATMPFASHFFNLFSLKNVEVKVHFHPVTYYDQYENRKQCAQHCFALIEKQLSHFNNWGTENGSESISQ